MKYRCTSDILEWKTFCLLVQLYSRGQVCSLNDPYPPVSLAKGDSIANTHRMYIFQIKFSAKSAASFVVAPYKTGAIFTIEFSSQLRWKEKTSKSNFGSL